MRRFRNGICQYRQRWMTSSRSKFCVSSFVAAVVCLNFIAIFMYSASVIYKNKQQVTQWVRNDPGSNFEATSATRMLDSVLVNITEDTPDEVVVTSIISALLNKYKIEHGHIPQSLLRSVLASANLTLPSPVSVENKGPVHQTNPEPAVKSPIRNFGLPIPPTSPPLVEKVTDSKQAVSPQTSSEKENLSEKLSSSKDTTTDKPVHFGAIQKEEPKKRPKKTEGGLKSCTEYTQGKTDGSLKPVMETLKPEELQAMFPEVQNGGHYSPTKCIPKERTAILIPYRNRYNHLHILLRNLFPLLLRQEVDFTIFVIDQALPDPFNRGMLFNVGYLEALKRGDFDCFIYHDVDLIPINGSNYYHCNEAPTHFIAGVDKFGYKLLYSFMFGGVTAFTKEQFRKINGASNLYFGWGGEDDDLRKRVMEKGYNPLRTDRSVGLYDMIKHSRDSKNAINPSRGYMLKTSTRRIDVEGLNTTVYTTQKVEALPLYTWVTVNINMTEVLATAPDYMHWEVNKLKKLYHL